MNYKKFEDIFNQTIFERSKPDLIRKIASYPERYAGLFRPTKPKAKIIQNLSQSHEIRFGDAFEVLIEQYLRENNFNILNKRFGNNSNSLVLDQMFANDDTVFFVEQKVRDDHDSSKKRGQIDNFEKKIAAILERYDGVEVVGFFYFIDASFTKNKKFYREQIQKLSDNYGLVLYLSYGCELFSRLRMSIAWEEIVAYLKVWKNNIPDLPEINFDRNAELSFGEIKNLESIIYRKLFSNPDLDDFLSVLSPEQTTLNLLNEHFQSSHNNGEGEIYKTLNELCTTAIHRITAHSSGLANAAS